MNKQAKKNQYVVLISIDGLAGYYLKDPQAKMPHLREIIRQGAAAEAMVSVFPTATWAIHTSMVTGCYPRKHGVLGNWVVDRLNRRVGEHFGDRMWSKEESVQRPTIYDAAKQQGWTTASVCWPVTRGAASIDWCIPEFYEQHLFESYSTPSLWRELQEAGLPVECYGEWSKDHARNPMQDWLTTEVAKHLIRTHKPNLLMLHYLLPDSLQHDYGTRSKEVYWALDYVDERIGDVVETLKQEGIWDQTDLFVVSDHGFIDTTRTFYPNVLFKHRGWLDSDNLSGSKVIAVSNGGSGFVYVLADDPAEREQLRQEALELLQRCDGVGKVFEREDFPGLGLPPEGELEQRLPDLAFESAMDCFVYFGHEGEEVMTTHTKFKGMHGYLPHHEELKAMFAACGRSVKQGVTLPEIHIIDVAPTIMRIIGNETADMDGKVLDDIWKECMTVGNGDYIGLKTK